MTDKNKYSNISVTKETYSYLQKLSKEILPGNTPLSISKTVTYLVNCKIKESNEYLRSQGFQIEENFTQPKKIIDWVINNKNNTGDKNGKK